MNSKSQKIQTYKILHVLENAPGQLLVTEIYIQNHHSLLTCHFFCPQVDSVIATVHLKTFAKPVIGGGRKKLLQHLV